MRSKIITFVFGLLIAACFVMMMVFPPDIESIEKENRTMTQFPQISSETVFSGTFSKDFESYLNDKVGFRGILTDASAKLGSMKGIPTSFGTVKSIDKDMGTGVTQKTSLLLYQDSIMEIYKTDKAVRGQYIAALNKYAEGIRDDVQMYAMIVPTQLSFMPDMYANIQSNQKDTIDFIYQNMNSRIRGVDAYSNLQAHTSEYEYFRTDHHWTQLGAYYAYVAYCDAAGLEPVAIDAVEKKNRGEFLGSLYDQAQAFDLADKPDTLEWYDVDPDGQMELTMRGLDENGVLVDYQGTLYDQGMEKTKYAFFMGGDHPMARIENPNAQTDRSLIIIKDSYANAFIPWICCNYRRVIVLDPRSLWTSVEDVLDGYGTQDFLFLNYVFSTSFEDYCSLIDSKFDQISEQP